VSWRSLGACAAVLALASCGQGAAGPATNQVEEVGQASRIDAAAWAAASIAEDPFIEHEAGRFRCSPFAFRLEATWLEITTTDCNYATLVYRFPAAVLAGDVVSGEIAWAPLIATAPAVGTLAFATLRGGVVWSHEVAIPGDGDIVAVEFEVRDAAPAGSALYFHVRNHGYNTWQLSPLTLDGSASGE